MENNLFNHFLIISLNIANIELINIQNNNYVSIIIEYNHQEFFYILNNNLTVP